MKELISSVYMVVTYIFLTYMFLIIFTGVFAYRKDKKKIYKRKKKKREEELYFFIIIPCYNEEKAIGKTLSKLFSNKFNGEAVVVDDDSSDNTAQIVERYPYSRIKLIRRKLPFAQKGKGDSLNQALRYIEKKSLKLEYASRNIIVGVLDADGAVSDHAFEELEKNFANPKINVVQLRVKMYNTFKNMLQVSQDVEFFTINNISQITRGYSATVGLSGNGQFFRLGTVLSKLGNKPWGTALLDDYEMTLKLMLEGVRITYISEAYVYQEALSSVKKFIIQRSRWVQGNLDCLNYLKRTMKSKRINKTQKLGILYFLIQPWINLIADIIIVVLFFNLSYTIIFDGKITISLITSMIGLFLFSLVWGIYFTYLYVKDLNGFEEIKPTRRLIIELPFMISYVYIILFFSIIIAFWRKALGKNNWFKTERG